MSKVSFRRGICPFPVYEGHFEDGRMLRMSFWSRWKKPLDIARGRRMVMLVGQSRGYGEMLRGIIEYKGIRTMDFLDKA